MRTSRVDDGILDFRGVTDGDFQKKMPRRTLAKTVTTAAVYLVEWKLGKIKTLNRLVDYVGRTPVAGACFLERVSYIALTLPLAYDLQGTPLATYSTLFMLRIFCFGSGSRPIFSPISAEMLNSKKIISRKDAKRQILTNQITNLAKACSTTFLSGC